MDSSINTRQGVSSDLMIFSNELSKTLSAHRSGSEKELIRPLFDILSDWTMIVLAVLAYAQIGAASLPLVVIVIGNRQRALGNLLHEASHRNLFKSRAANDLAAKLFLAPALLNDLAVYRESHAKHHAFLGCVEQDPDYIAPLPVQTSNWRVAYCRLLFSRAAWMASVLGHVGAKGASWHRLAYIGFWWSAILWLLSSYASQSFAAVFVMLWFIAKATAFHAITTFREMCDHFALQPGGIFSYARDIVSKSPWRWLIHPHNNAFHLTHHLMPSVPYYRLPDMQKALSALPSYRRRGIRSHAYFAGTGAVVCDWGKGKGMACNAA